MAVDVEKSFNGTVRARRQPHAAQRPVSPKSGDRGNLGEYYLRIYCNFLPYLEAHPPNLAIFWVHKISKYLF